MKKIVSVMLALVLVLSVLSCAALAYDDDIVGTVGDYNDDGLVKLEDARAVLSAAVGITAVKDNATFRRCDINGDGKLSLFDARQILKGAVGLVKLESTGLFKGVTDEAGVFTSKEELVNYFNTNLDRIKTERPGLTKTEKSTVSDINVTNPKLLGFSFGTGADLLVKELSELIMGEGNDKTLTYINPGDQNWLKVSVEEEEYVSKLNANDVYGAKVELDETRNELKITIALADTMLSELENSSYAKVFNTENMKSTAISLLTAVSTSLVSDNLKIEYQNATLTAVFDYTTGNVKNYKTSYSSEIFVDATGVTLLKLLSVDTIDYKSSDTVEYRDFNWVG